MPAFDAVICGAGVGGLTLAHILGRAGRRVLLVEKQRRPRTVHKGELLQPRSLEILQGIDLLPHMSARGVVRVDRLICRTAQGAELVPLDYGMLPGPFNHGLIHYYHQMKEAIAGQLGPSVEFWRGVRVEDLIRDSTGRVAGVRLLADGERIDVDAPLTVAADGHASRLREAAGIHVPMRRYGHQLVAFDIGGVPGLGQDMAAYLTRDGLRVLFQMPGDRARLYVQIPAGGFRDVGRAGLPEWIDRLLRTVPALAPIAGPLRESQHGVQVLSAWRFNAPAPTRPGVVLLGDAAHCVHPMVGQGMNAAIGDAWVLGRQLAGAGALTPAAVDAALERYVAERRPQMAYVARLSHNLATLFTATSWRARVARPHMLRRNRRNVRLQYLITHNMAGYGVRSFTPWDWICASGVLPDPRATSVPAYPR